MKQKIAFAMIMGLITTGIISFTLMSIHRGFVPGFLAVWTKSWMIAYGVAIPVILVVAPRVQAFVAGLFRENE